jgi:hypothetical protein
MNLMDHSEALKLQAAEKYVLGELSPALRDEYEEHYFDCQECAADLKAAAAFADASRVQFRSEPREVFLDQELAPQTWFAWLRPIVLVPALAVLAAALAYQSFVTIPHLQRGTAAPTTGSASFISLIGANSRGEAAKSFAIQQNQPVILEVDIPPLQDFSSYLCQVQDAAGHVAYRSQVSAADAKQSVHLIVPAGTLQPQTYMLSILGQKGSGSQPGAPPEITRFPFTIEFGP